MTGDDVPTDLLDDVGHVPRPRHQGHAPSSMLRRLVMSPETVFRSSEHVRALFNLHHGPPRRGSGPPGRRPCAERDLALEETQAVARVLQVLRERRQELSSWLMYPIIRMDTPRFSASLLHAPPRQPRMCRRRVSIGVAESSRGFQGEKLARGSL